MANATSGPIHEEAGTRHGHRSRGRAASGPAIASGESRVADADRPPERLRHSLAWLGRLLDVAGDREKAAEVLLDLVNGTFPARHSALLVARDDAEGEPLEVLAARGDALTLDQAEWVERTARESLARCQVLGRELPGTILSSFLWIPILFRGRRLAVLELGEGRGHWFAGDRTRGLSGLADDIGHLLDGVFRIEHSEHERRTLERRLVAQSRRVRELEARVVNLAGRDVLMRAALRRAEQAVDPAHSVVSNLHATRDAIGAVHDALEQLSRASASLLEAEGDEAHESARAAVTIALERARSNEIHSRTRELSASGDEVEEGLVALRELVVELREYSLGEAAPDVWVDVHQLLEAGVECLVETRGDETRIDLQIGELPPVRCQRLRVECLLVLLLERALDLAEPGGDVVVVASRCGNWVEIEIDVEEFSTSANDLVESIRKNEDAFFARLDHARAARDLVEDQGGRLDIAAAEDLVAVRVRLPVDSD